MNPNPKVKFKYPLSAIFSEIFFLGITLLFFILTFGIFLSIRDFSGDVTVLELISTSLFTLGFLIFIIILMYKESIILKQPIIYFRYKKVFSEHPIISDSDFVAVTNGKYGDRDEVRYQIRKFTDGKFIIGCKLAVIDGEWKLVCPLTNGPLIPQQPVADKKATTD